MNKSFFNESSSFKDEIFFTTGVLAKVAVYSNWATFEDGSSINRSLSQKLASYATMHKAVYLGVNSNIIQIVNIGDKIQASKPLITFEKSFQDESINKVLAKLGDEFDQTIESLSKNTYTSKYSGEIVSIDIKYNVPLETLSPSLQKLIKKYKAENNKKQGYLKKVLKGLPKEELEKYYRINGIFKELDQIKSTKLKSKDHEGVLIEFFIKTLQEVTVGNKITFSVAVKSIVSEVIDDDKSPYSEENPEENIDALISSISPLNRLCGDFFYQICINKVLLGLKDKVKQLLKE